MERDGAVALDLTDPLAPAREAFRIPDGVLPLNGNSLGALQPAVEDRVRRVVTDEWGIGLKRSWNDAGWASLPQQVAARIAPLIGADRAEVAVADSTSVDLFKAVVAARRLRPDRRVILTDDRNFPSDRYVVAGVAELLADTEVVVVAPDEVEGRLTDDVAVLTMTHVDYRSGRLQDAARLTAAAHDAGAVAVWDLSHSTGAVHVDLADWHADLAVGCTYKYLSGGPGAPAYLFAAARHHDELRSPIAGWFGHAAPFAFGDAYAPGAGADRFLAGTPPILSLAALDAALEVWEDVEIGEVPHKSRALTSLFVALVDERLGDLGVRVASPRVAEQRGAQVSLAFDDAGPLGRAATEAGVLADVRPPDILRFGFAPLYVRYRDVWDAVDVLHRLLSDRAWEDPRFSEPEHVS
ncbi:MAG: kynureninase [Actinobacteria bacterium]|nr:kynureninase [Actinomycetota bacterium]